MFKYPVDGQNCVYYFRSVVLSQGTLLSRGHLVALRGEVLVVTLGEKGRMLLVYRG